MLDWAAMQLAAFKKTWKSFADHLAHGRELAGRIHQTQKDGATVGKQHTMYLQNNRLDVNHNPWLESEGMCTMMSKTQKCHWLRF